jgi:hypothetical protein
MVTYRIQVHIYCGEIIPYVRIKLFKKISEDQDSINVLYIRL